jgi:hypothetical protein
MFALEITLCTNAIPPNNKGESGMDYNGYNVTKK